MSYHIASVSWGRDSLAMLLYILDHPSQYPLDEVCFYNTGMEFDAILRNRDKMIPILQQRGIKYMELHPQREFLHDMLEKPVYSKKNGHHIGYGWCGGGCSWGTWYKTDQLDKYARTHGDAVSYVGIAYDEKDRRAELENGKTSPLIDAEMTEADCPSYCRERGWNWSEATPATESRVIDLYDILDRVSCWCCANKNLKELRNIYRYLPQYWKRLLELQSKIERPFKRYKNRKYGEYGDIRILDRIFKEELK